MCNSNVAKYYVPILPSRDWKKSDSECSLNDPKLSYESFPDKLHRVRGHVNISSDLVQKLKSNTEHNFKDTKCGTDHRRRKCNCDGLYLYLDIDIGMQFNLIMI